MTTNEGVSDNEMAAVTSWFIINACQFLPKAFNLETVSENMHYLSGSPNHISKQYSILCGSLAEFYIRPLNTCIDDFDVLVPKADKLAFSGNFPLLPSDMSGLSDHIKCYKIEACDRFPGFVRLRNVGLMRYNWYEGQYKFHYKTQQNTYLYAIREADASDRGIRANKKEIVLTIANGPALKFRSAFEDGLPSDNIMCFWCPQWPKEAKNWPKRPRNFGWPTTDTISKVVQNGCHIVHAQHRSCRDDEFQWRLSFSFAEIILLQSWTPIQQIVYHMLRFFAKRELLQNNCPKEDEVLSTYHLKTLMLWTCEEMTPEWWISSSVIAICCKLLQRLSDWLNLGYCPNYFIPAANLFHRPFNSLILDKTKKRLNEFRYSYSLGQWFSENYLMPVSLLIGVYNGARMTSTKIAYLLHLHEIRKARESDSLDLLFFFENKRSYRLAIKKRFASGLREILMLGYYKIGLSIISGRKLKQIFYPTIQKIRGFRHYDNLLCTLHVAYGLDCGEMSWNSLLLDEFVMANSMQPKIIRSWYHNVPKMHTTQNTWFQFLRAQNLLENLIGSNYLSKFQLVSLMSKNILKQALEYSYPDCKCFAPAALTYLAALHFFSSEYQQAIRCCLEVLVDQNSQEKVETLNAACLLFIDDVARIVGLYILCKKITENGLHYIGRRIYLDLRLSPKVFAHHLIVASDRRKLKHSKLNFDLQDSAFQMDEYLKASIKSKHRVSNKQIVYLRIGSLTETEFGDTNPVLPVLNETLINVLMEYALEHMTTFYSLICKDFGIQCNTTDCYRALYLYKCRRYHEAFDLCEQILYEPDLHSDLKKLALANVLLLPPLDSFFDKEVQSLLGLHTLFYYLSPLNDEMRKCEITPESSFAHHFSKATCFHGNDLSRHLTWNYSVKCNYFVGRHFIARYLKVRCCNDCNLPYEDALAEFTVQKTTKLPFEQIIHRFLIQKLRDVKTI